MIVDDFLRRYDRPGGLVHVSGLRRAHMPAKSMDGSYSALCTFGTIVALSGPLTEEAVTCLYCVQWISFEVPDDYSG